MWIPIEDELLYKHKTGRLRKILGLTTTRETISYLVSLWLFTLKVAGETGDLSAYDTEMIEKACEWEGKPGELLKAFQECGAPLPDGKRGSGYMDGSTVHDWAERNRRMIRDRIYHREKREGVEPERKDNPEAAKIFERWNTFAAEHGLPKAARAPRLPEDFSYERFELLLVEVIRQPFLLGGGKDKWRIDLIWLLKPENSSRVMEGAYFERKGTANGGEVVQDDYRARTQRVLRERGLIK